MKSVTLGITTYGGAHLLETCLKSIKKSVHNAGYSNFSIIVVDDGTPEKINFWNVIEKAKLPKVTSLIGCDEQKGNVARYNTIVEKSDGDIVFLIDNDVVLPDRWFTSAYYFLANNEKVGVASFLSQKVTESDVEKLLAEKKIPAVGSGRVPERATELAGYCYGFTRESFNLVGGFDSENFKYFVGDSDFCCRLAEKGLMSYRLLYPVIYHREHATYDGYKELDAWNRVKTDLANFNKKWGCTPKQKESQLLEKFEPRRIKWYAHYSPHEDWDRKAPEFEDFRPHIIPEE